MMASNTITEQELLDIYTKSFNKQLAQLKISLATIEQDPESPEARHEHLFTVYRCMHNIKGGAAIVSIESMMQIAQQLESIYKNLQEQKLSPSDDLIKMTKVAIDNMHIALTSYINHTELPFDLMPFLADLDEIMPQKSRLH